MHGLVVPALEFLFHRLTEGSLFHPIPDILEVRRVGTLYRIPEEKVLSVVEFPQARAVKATIVRPLVSGDPGDSDVYGAQQHAPLLDIVVPTR